MSSSSRHNILYNLKFLLCTCKSLHLFHIFNIHDNHALILVNYCELEQKCGHSSDDHSNDQAAYEETPLLSPDLQKRSADETSMYEATLSLPLPGPSGDMSPAEDMAHSHMSSSEGSIHLRN